MMKLKYLIESLQKTLEELGPDAELAMITDTPDGLFHLDFDPVVDVIQIPNEHTGKLSDEFTVIGWSHCFEGCGESAKICLVKEFEADDE